MDLYVPHPPVFWSTPSAYVSSAFAHDQTPNNNLVAGAPVWPSYGPSGGQHIVFQGFGGGSFIENDNFREAGIAFINQKTVEVAKAL